MKPSDAEWVREARIWVDNGLSLCSANSKRLLSLLDEQQKEVEGLRGHLTLVLPMAKGYVAEHRVGCNQQIIDEAEIALSGEAPKDGGGVKP